jgi:hypothetical protein
LNFAFAFRALYEYNGLRWGCQLFSKKEFCGD